MYIHERENWTNFRWDASEVSLLQERVFRKQGLLYGRLSSLGFDSKLRAMAVKEIISFLTDYSGSYKKTPAGFPSEGPDAAFYRLRNIGLWYYPDNDFLTAPHLVERLVDIYQTARPFVSYINRAIDYNDEQ